VNGILKRFSKFNVVDIFLVLLVLAIVYGAYLFSMPQQAIAESGTQTQFTIELAERPAGFYRQIEAGSTVFESSRGVPIGTVVRAYGLPFLQDVQDNTSMVFRRSPVEGREFTYVVIETWTNVSDFETEVNQIRIGVNRELYVRSKHFAGRAFITNLIFLE